MFFSFAVLLLHLEPPNTEFSQQDIAVIKLNIQVRTS